MPSILTCLFYRLDELARSENLEKMLAVCEKAESLFGTPAGEKLRVIEIINDDKITGAFVSIFTPWGIRISDECLLSGEDPGIVAFHETIHLIDEHLKISDGIWAEQYKALFKKGFIKSGGKFFSSLDEDRFFNLQYAGGHSADSPKEFLASFLNSLMHPEWKQKLASSDLKFRAKYKDTIIILESRLRELDGVPPDAPIYELLKDRLEQL